MSDPNQELENSVSSENQSVLSGESEKNKNENTGDFNEEVDSSPLEMPKKPASAYVTVSILCLMIAFGGYVYGWCFLTVFCFQAVNLFSKIYVELC